MFHAQENWYFERQSDGSVRIIKKVGARLDTEILEETTIPPSAWASIVSSMSSKGETFDTWKAALDFHG